MQSSKSITYRRGCEDVLVCREDGCHIGSREGRKRATRYHAFWSVTMYDGKSQFLIENPMNRYLINSPMLPDMKTNADGSLTLFIQKDFPGKDKEANWLPAPDGLIYLVMRLYWPKETPPSILPAGEGTWKPPAVVQAA
jgi:hypothetical protein